MEVCLSGSFISGREFRFSLGNVMYVTANTETLTWDSITYALTAGTWYYVTVTWDMNLGLRLYINGLQVASHDVQRRNPPVSSCCRFAKLADNISSKTRNFQNIFAG